MTIKTKFEVIIVFDDGKKLDDIKMNLPYVPREGEMFYKSDTEPYLIRGVSYWHHKEMIMVMAEKLRK